MLITPRSASTHQNDQILSSANNVHQSSSAFYKSSPKTAH